MNKGQLLQRLDSAWRDFQASYEGISEAEMVEPGAGDDWSIRDLITHVAIWEEEALKHLPLILGGIREPRYSTQYGGIDAFNATAMAERARLSLPDVLMQAQQSHERLVSFIETSAPDEQVATETRFRRRLRLDTYAHYALHAHSIRQRRERAAYPKTPALPRR